MELSKEEIKIKYHLTDENIEDLTKMIVEETRKDERQRIIQLVRMIPRKSYPKGKHELKKRFTAYGWNEALDELTDLVNKLKE